MGWGFREPIYWPGLTEAERENSELNPDLCVIRADNETHYFMYALLGIPIQQTEQTVEIGVWMSLSENSYREVCENWKNPGRIHTGPHVGYLSNRMPYYPDTLSLIGRVHHREPGKRPWVELKPEHHPLVVHAYEGISAAELQTLTAALLHSA